MLGSAPRRSVVWIQGECRAMARTSLGMQTPVDWQECHHLPSPSSLPHLSAALTSSGMGVMVILLFNWSPPVKMLKLPSAISH